jgi:hypothetical protein
MAKIKKCLDTDCTKYYFLDDNKLVHAPKPECDSPSERRKNPRNKADFKTMFNQYARNVTRTVYMSDDPGWKEGDDATL